jgi:RNA polymerase sigma factor (sigma-70 family)
MRSESIADLESLNRTYRPVLVRYFQRHTRSHSEAEDLAQEVFIRLAGARIVSSASAEAYIFQIARNLVRDRSRRERVRADHRARMGALEQLGIDPLDPHRIVAAHDSLERILAGLGDLPERTRRIFILYRMENVDKRTIAQSFGISRSAVDKHISRAVAFLSDMLGDMS